MFMENQVQPARSSLADFLPGVETSGGPIDATASLTLTGAKSPAKEGNVEASC